MPKLIVSVFLCTLLTLFSFGQNQHFSASALKAPQVVTVLSRDGRTEVRLSVGTTIRYSVSYQHRQVIDNSPISLTVDGAVLGQNAIVKAIHRDSARSVITPLYGKFARLTDEYRQLRVDFTQPFSLVLRVYDEGIAWRWITSFTSDITVNMEEV